MLEDHGDIINDENEDNNWKLFFLVEIKVETYLMKMAFELNSF